MNTGKWIAFTLMFMGIGVVLELFLITHYEDTWQLVPIVLILFTAVCFILLKRGRSSFTRKIFKAALLCCAVSGFIGIYFHLQANWEFETELHPGQDLITNFTESMSGALPALAPGSMVVFALIGYIYIQQFDKHPKYETTH